MDKSLTESEEISLNWLKNQGYSNIEKIDKGGRPDFKADGEWFEVKKLRGKNLVFTKKQLKSFQDIQLEIIVVGDDFVESLPFDEIADSYNLVSQPTYIQIRDKTKEELDRIKKEEDHTSYDSVIKTLIERSKK